MPRRLRLRGACLDTHGSCILEVELFSRQGDQCCSTASATKGGQGRVVAWCGNLICFVELVFLLISVHAVSASLDADRSVVEMPQTGEGCTCSQATAAAKAAQQAVQPPAEEAFANR